MSIISRKKDKKAILGDSEYLTLKEERRIAKENLQITKHFEKQKRKKSRNRIILPK